MQKQQGGQGSGFIITCDKNKQKQAIKDAYNFLNQYIEDIYGDIETQIIQKELQAKGKEHDLQNEMQARSNLKNKLRILSAVDTNVNCLVFIKINEGLTPAKIDPYKVVDAIMKDVHKQDRQITRFCHKIMPVERSFKAEHFKMLDEIDSMFQARDNSQMKSWALLFKCRNNSKFNYKQVLGETQKIAKKYGHFVDIYYPQWTIAVEIAHHLMCLSIVEKYKEFDEFRLHKKGKVLANKPEGQSKPQIMRQKREEKERNWKQKQQRPKDDRNIDKKQAHAESNKEQKQQQIEKQPNEQQQKEIDGEKQHKKLLQQKIQVADDEDVQFI